VKLPDVGKAECLRYLDKIGTAALEAWFSLSGVPAETMATPLLALWQQAVEDGKHEPGIARWFQFPSVR